MDSLRFWTDKPMSSAKARSVDVVGSVFASWSISISRQRTKRVGDIGQPCRTPDRRVIEGYSSFPIFSWCKLLLYRS